MYLRNASFNQQNWYHNFYWTFLTAKGMRFKSESLKVMKKLVCRSVFLILRRYRICNPVYIFIPLRRMYPPTNLTRYWLKSKLRCMVWCHRGYISLFRRKQVTYKFSFPVFLKCTLILLSWNKGEENTNIINLNRMINRFMLYPT